MDYSMYREVISQINRALLNQNYNNKQLHFSNSFDYTNQIVIYNNKKMIIIDLSCYCLEDIRNYSSKWVDYKKQIINEIISGKKAKQQICEEYYNSYDICKEQCETYEICDLEVTKNLKVTKNLAVDKAMTVKKNLEVCGTIKTDKIETKTASTQLDIEGIKINDNCLDANKIIVREQLDLQDSIVTKNDEALLGWWLATTKTFPHFLSAYKFYKKNDGKILAEVFGGSTRVLKQFSLLTSSGNPFWNTIGTEEPRSIRVDKLNDKAYILNAVDQEDVFEGDENTMIFRIQDSDPNIAFLSVDICAQSYPNVEVFYRKISAEEIPPIISEDLHNFDVNDPVANFNYLFEEFSLLLTPLMNQQLDANTVLSYDKFKALRDQLLETGVTYESNVVDVWRTRGYFEGLTTIFTDKWHNIFVTSRVIITGFTGEYAVLNTTTPTQVITVQNIRNVDFAEIYSTDHVDLTNLVHWFNIKFDSSSLPPYNQSIHGVAKVTAVYNRLTSDSEYLDFANVTSLLLSSLAHTNITQPSVYIDILNFPPEENVRICETFQAIQDNIDTNGFVPGGSMASRLPDISHAPAFYRNPRSYINFRFGTNIFNDPRDISVYDNDDFLLDIDINNYLDKTKIFQIYFAVEGPVLPEVPLTGILASIGYKNNGSEFVFTADTVNPDTDKWVLMTRFGVENLLMGSIIDPTLTGGEIIAYLRVSYAVQDNNFFIHRPSVFWDKDNKDSLFNYRKMYGAMMKKLLSFNPTKFIIDQRDGYAFFWEVERPLALASFFGDNRPGLDPVKIPIGTGYEPLMRFSELLGNVQTENGGIDNIIQKTSIIDVERSEQVVPGSIFKSDNGTKDVIILTSINTTVTGDIFPTLMLNTGADTRDIGDGIKTKIVGDINGIIMGTGDIRADAYTPISDGSRIKFPNGRPVPLMPYHAATDYAYIRSESGQPLTYQYEDIKPDLLLDGSFKVTIYPDVGATTPHPLAPLAGWTKTGGIQEVTDVTTVADIAGSLNSTYFLISSRTVDYYVWFDVAAAGVDPTIGGRTGLKVSLTTNDIKEKVALNTAAILESTGAFFVEFLTDDTVKVTVKKGGDVLSAPAVVTSGFTIIISQSGVNNIVGQPAFDDNSTWRDTWLEQAISA